MTEASPALTLDDLVRDTGETPERILEWRAAGVLRGEPFVAEDIECARLIRFCLRRGYDVETIARAEREQPGFLRQYVGQLFPSGTKPAYSPAEAEAITGVDADLIRKLREISGSTTMKESLDQDDLEAIRGWKVALDNGLPEEALLQLVRVYADNLGRVAEAEARLFHFYVHERLRDGGLSGLELFKATEGASQRMRMLIEPALRYFHQNGMAAALREDMLMHLAEYSGHAEKREAPGQVRLAIVFLDLASFTPMTVSMGDVAAAEVVARFSELVHDVVGRHHGRVVERIGDAFMLTFSDASSAVACALEIEAQASEEDQFPAIRGGIHVGPVLYRGGGYVGSNVNLASRVAGEARRHQIIVTADVRKEAGTLAGVEFMPLGMRHLKGLADEVELFEARSSSAQHGELVIDPVCGMALTPAGVAARLAFEGKDYPFCSEACLRMFVAEPARYRIA